MPDTSAGVVSSLDRILIGAIPIGSGLSKVTAHADKAATFVWGFAKPL